MMAGEELIGIGWTVVHNCIVKHCPNKSDQGMGFMIRRFTEDAMMVPDVWICAPCWEELTERDAIRASIIHRLFSKEALMGEDEKVVKETQSYVVREEVLSEESPGCDDDGTEHIWTFAIQKVTVKDREQWEGIRFVYYRDGKLIARPPVFPPDIVLHTLMGAIKAGIFTH
jgi:hypothetical protein